MIICDEVFSGLSASEISSLVPLIEKLHDQGITLIMIEHRLRGAVPGGQPGGGPVLRARRSPRATPAEVMEHPKVREAYMGSEEGVVC